MAKPSIQPRNGVSKVHVQPGRKVEPTYDWGKGWVARGADHTGESISPVEVTPEMVTAAFTQG